MNFASRLQALRAENNITQAALADFLHVGRPTIAGYETKNKQPDYSKLCVIADYFKVSVDYLIGHTNIKNATTPATLPADKKELLQLYAALSERNQGAWMERGRLLLEEQDRKEKQCQKSAVSKVVSK